MQTINKNLIQPEKLLRKDELIILKGGGETTSHWLCKYHNGEEMIILGCVNLSNCNSAEAWNCCLSNFPTCNEMAGGCTGPGSGCISCGD
jgi:hypothetical protein